MRWKGKSAKERMVERHADAERWQKEKAARDARRISWRPWFAWRPVHIDEGPWVWLEWVERKRYDPDSSLRCYRGIIKGTRV